MRLNRPLVLAAYVILVVVVLTPLVEMAVAVRPYRFSETAWRFGAIGVASRATIVPLFGLLLLSVLAVALGQRGALRVFSVVSAVSGVAVLVAAGVFVLDALQLRRQVRTELLSSYDTSTVVALCTMLAVAVGCSLLSIGAWIGSRRGPGHAAQPSVLIR